MTEPVSHSSLFKFCPHCATTLEDFVHEDLIRKKCPTCSWIQYRNPTVGVAVALVENGQLLIGRRRDGGLCIPCGHVEWDESVEDAACREFEEETGLRVSLTGVIAVKSNFHAANQRTVGIWFSGQREAGELRPGSDLVDVYFVKLTQVPPLQFPTDMDVVELLSSTR